MRIRDERTDFSAGVVSEEYLAKDNQQLAGQALKTGLNIWVDNAATVRRRFGTSRDAAAVAGREEIFDLQDGDYRRLLFYAGGVRIYQPDGTLEQTLTTNVPWGSGDIDTMSIANEDLRTIIVSRSFWPRVLNYNGSTFSCDDLTYDVRNNLKRAPFVRFKADGVTMSLNSYAVGTGRTMTFSGDVLKTDGSHVGVRFKYVNCQVEITGVSDARNATVTIREQIYPTRLVTVSDGSAYKVGEVARADESGTEGVVTSVSGNVVTITNINGYGTYRATADGVDGELVITDEASQVVLSVSTASTPAATVYWTEELISAARGYPGTASLHRRRLCLADFPEAQNVLIASAVGRIFDYSVGTGRDSDAIIDALGDDPNARIRHLVSTEQMLVFTDRGCYYMPEANDRRFIPTQIEFNHIGPDNATATPPVVLPEGVAFVDNQDRVLLASMTGSPRSPWKITELTPLGYHLLSSPKRLTYAPGVGGRPERCLVALNADGTAAAMIYKRDSEQAGWVKWQRGKSDQFHSFVSWAGELFICATADGDAYLETADFAKVLDSQESFAVAASASESVHLLWGLHVVKAVSANGSGVVPDGNFTNVTDWGHDFGVEWEPAPYKNSNAGRQRRRIVKAWLDAINSGNYRAMGKLMGGRRFGSNPEGAPPVNDRENRVSQIGSGHDKTMKIEQLEGEGAPHHIRSLTMVVSVK